MPKISDETWNWICKVLLPALAAMTISVATQMKNKTANWLTTSTSVVIGLCTAYIFGYFIIDYFSAHTSPIMIAAIAMCGEKISYWLLYNFNFDVIGEAIVSAIKSKIK